MKAINLLFLLGTRPEAIKLAPLIKVFSENKNFSVKVALTAQHRELLDQVIDFFEIKVDYDLNVMTPNQTLPNLTATLIDRITSEILLKNHFEYVFVQGDTTTVLAGAMAAFYQQIKIVHIEAGLRSHNLQSPFPEEMNRLLTSKLADYHFCPTENARQNLDRENISKNVYVVGNTVIDSLFYGLEKVNSTSDTILLEKYKSINFSKKIILVTCHRRENFGIPFNDICTALLEITNNFSSEIQIVFPVHPNPNIKNVVTEKLNHPNIHLIEALDYPELIWMMQKSNFVITDSGGIQEEAPSIGKPVLVLRNETERTEGIDAGTAMLVGTNHQKIVDQATKLLRNQAHFDHIATASNPYGDGKAADKILQILIDKN